MVHYRGAENNGGMKNAADAHFRDFDSGDVRVDTRGLRVQRFSKDLRRHRLNGR